jgi:hypothetical protein
MCGASKTHPVRWTQITSRSFDWVVSDLRITPAEMKSMKGAKVLSIGEGFSSFAKGLEENGARVVAVDPLYALSPGELDPRPCPEEIGS